MKSLQRKTNDNWQTLAGEYSLMNYLYFENEEYILVENAKMLLLALNAMEEEFF